MARRPRSENKLRKDLLIEFCVEGVALSARCRNRAKLQSWKDKVASRARTKATELAPFEGTLEICLSEFSETRRRDRDNFAKPIQDAMQGILFPNDRQVSRLESEWCDINDRYRVRFMSKVLAEALVAGHEFVWIRIYRHLPRETLIP